MRYCSRRVSLILVSCLAVAAVARAQDFQGGLQFMLGVPQTDFASSVGRNGYGLTGQIGFAPGRAPFFVGVELGFMNYGSEKRQEPFSTTIPDVTVDVTTSNNFFTGMAMIRLQPNRGMFRPYAELVAGVNYLFTTTEIDNRGRGGEEVASSTNVDDAAFAYGAGGGVMLRVYEASDDTDGIREVLIDFRTRYTRGGEAQYLKEGSIRRENGRVTYDVVTSSTDLLSFHIGVSLRF